MAGVCICKVNVFKKFCRSPPASLVPEVYFGLLLVRGGKSAQQGQVVT